VVDDAGRSRETPVSAPFSKLYRHRDHKIEAEMANLYAVVTSLRQNARGINARAYAEALKNEWGDHELAVLERYMNGKTRAEGFRIEATHTIDGVDPLAALYVDATAGASGSGIPVAFYLQSGAGLNSYLIDHTGACAAAVKINQTGTTGYALHLETTNFSDEILRIDSSGTHTGNYIETDNGAVCNNAGAWVNASSAALKDIKDVAGVDDVLGDILDIPLYRYRMKSDASGPVYMGAMAEDWNRIFGDRSPGGIGGVDAAMVSLAGVQSLAKKVEALEERIRQLEASHAP